MECLYYFIARESQINLGSKLRDAFLLYENRKNPSNPRSISHTGKEVPRLESLSRRLAPLITISSKPFAILFILSRTGSSSRSLSGFPSLAPSPFYWYGYIYPYTSFQFCCRACIAPSLLPPVFSSSFYSTGCQQDYHTG
jgi:hypothetical protein